VLRLPNCTVVGWKLLLNPGLSATTVRVADALPLLPACEVRSPDVFTYVPGVPIVTPTLIVHAVCPANLPSLREIELPPSGALNVPSQLETALDGVAIVMPLGRLSVNARPLTGPVDPFVIVNWSVLMLPGPMVLGANDFVNVGRFADCATASHGEKTKHARIERAKRRSLAVIVVKLPVVDFVRTVDASRSKLRIQP
jgi:hypothetical protein